MNEARAVSGEPHAPRTPPVAASALRRRHSPREWRVHIGAHKTATTHFQRLLADVGPLVQEKGGVVLLEDTLRGPARSARRDRSGLGGLRHRLRLSLRTPARLRAAAGDCRFVVASEEDILGSVPDLLQNDFYPDLRGIDLLRRTARGARLDLFVSIRSYDTLLTSALFEMLKAFPDARRQWEQGAARLLAECSGWPGLMARVGRRAPEARLHFWRLESYSRDPGAVLRQFIGIDVPDLPPSPPPSRTRAPALSALDEVAALDPGLPSAERVERVRAIYKRHPAGPGEPSAVSALLAPTDAAALADRYAEDVAVLRARYPELGAA
jgi:hypothetical protein